MKPPKTLPEIHKIINQKYKYIDELTRKRIELEFDIEDIK